MMSLNAQSIRDKVVRVLKEHGGGARPVDEKTGAFVNPFEADKSQILLETRAFNQSPINAKKCTQILTKVLYLINAVGEVLTAKQKTELFFGITRLFQSSDQRLRRMVYLLIKTIEPSESEVFIVTSSLTKDMNSGNDCYRANALRVLSRIMDPSISSQIERYLKTAIVDQDPFVASSALVCGLTLLKTVPDLVRRWVNEVQQTVSSKHSMVQFHGLALLHELKANDTLALQKIVGGLTKANLKSGLAKCLMIRYATDILPIERDPQQQKAFFDHIESYLRNKAETVAFEAAKAFIDLAILDRDGHGGVVIFGVRDVTPAITVLQVFLNSPRPVYRFAAVRALHRLAQHRAHVVSRANADLERLLTDTNRNISTLALTTLLKTGHESSVDRLIKQVTGFINEIPDGFKVEIVRAVTQLCLAHPSKHKVLMSFLSSNLREEGSFEYKKDIVDSLILISHKIPQAQDAGLLHLCEFIEDCEYQSICCQILAFLGQKTPTTPNPSKYIRFIYNRLILENALVRAAGVDSLASVAMNCPNLRGDILLLLEGCLTDGDDEVRDRATLYYNAIARSIDPSEDPKFVDLLGDEMRETTKNATDGISEVSTTDEPPTIEELLDSNPPVSVDALFETLFNYAESNFEGVEQLDLAEIPSEDDYLIQKAVASAAVAAKAKKKAAAVEAPLSTVPLTAEISDGATSPSGLLSVISSVVSKESLGTIQHSCRGSPLTEKEAEYKVKVIKHLYASHVVLEFLVTNTMQDQILENVNIDLVPSDSEREWEICGSVPAEVISFSGVGAVFVVLGKPSPLSAIDVPTASFQAALTFLVKEAGDDIGYVDEYPLEPISISLGDYCLPRCLAPGEFKVIWSMLESEGHEAVAKLSLSYKSIEAAVQGLPATMNVAPCDECDSGVTAAKINHTLTMSGIFMGKWQVLCRCMIVMNAEHGCLLKLIVRSKNETVSNLMLKTFD